MTDLEKLKDHTFWDKSASSLWPASVFLLKRNLSQHLFPSKLSKDSAKSLSETLKKTALQTTAFENGFCFELNSLNELEQGFLLEHFFLSDLSYSLDQHPIVIIDKSMTKIVAINFDNHLTIGAIDCFAKWHETFEELLLIEKQLEEQQISFSFSPKVGYLTSHLNDCGTGLNVKAYLHLPALLQMEEIQEPFDKLEDAEVILTGILPEEQSDGFDGDVVVLKNPYCLGVSEEHILRKTYKAAQTLIRQEEFYRNKLKNGHYPDMKDLISKSFGILKHSYQLDDQDALSSLSFLKLGLQLGWVEGALDHEINQIFFKCRKGHLLSKDKKELTTDDLLHSRSEFIHKQLQSINLSI